MRPIRASRRVGLLAAGFIVGVLTTLAVGAVAATNAVGGTGDTDSIYRKLEVLAQVLGQIENHYVDTVSPTDLVYGAAKGAVSMLDEHSAFFTPEEYKELLDATEGEYTGVGIELDWEKDLPQVATVLAGSPAQRAGMQLGDRLVMIDRMPVASLSFETVQQRLHGPVGSKVVLTVRRPPRDEEMTFALVRSWVRIAPIESNRVDDGVLDVRIKSFSRRVTADFAALIAHEHPAAGLVIDLRGNPGGLFDEAVSMVDLFLRDGPIVTAIGRGGRVVEHYEAHNQGTKFDVPLAILIDHGSASAAEIVAGSLADRGRARLFGTTSYGKGSVQSVLDLADGSGLKLTVARYYTPSGRQIDRHGITPAEVIEVDKAVATTHGIGHDVSPDDPVLAAALTWLRAQGGEHEAHP